MDTSLPRMRRPKRKLCYLPSYENPPKSWTDKDLSLANVDNMFDDMDSPPLEDPHPPCSLFMTFDCESLPDTKVVSPIPPEEMGPSKDKEHTSTTSQNPKLDKCLDVPFVAHHPAKTSSPIEQNVCVRSEKELNNIKAPSVTPALFPLEQEVQDKVNCKPGLAQKHQSNEIVTQESDFSEPETPPCKIVIKKLVSLKKNTKSAWKETTQPDMPDVAERKQPESKTPKNSTKSCSQAGSDMTAFLQKLKLAVVSKPSCSQACVLPVEVPAPPPEPEDDFFILEDDKMTFQFSIPSKAARKQKQSKSSSSNKDSSSEKGSKESPVKTPLRKREASDKASDEPECQIVVSGTKKRREYKKNHEEAEPERCKTSSVSPEPPPVGDLKDQEKLIEKKLPKRVQSKKRAKNQLSDTESPDTEMHPQKPKVKAKKSSKTKNPKQIESKEENTKAEKFSKGRPSIAEQFDSEDLALPTGTQRVDSDQDGKEKQPRPAPEKSSSDDDHILGKRKRKPAGQWWMTNTETTDNQTDEVKKSKKPTQDSNTAGPLTAEKNMKDHVFKDRNQKETRLSSPILNQAKDKKTKQNKNRNTKKNAREKNKKTQEVEQVEEQKVVDQGMDQEQSSSSASTHSEEQVIQTKYDNRIVEKPVPSQLHEAESAKRRRKPTGNWWMLDAAVGVASQPLPHKEHKPSKTKKKPSKKSPSLEIDQRAAEELSSKPAGGAPVCSPKMKPMFTPKTVKRSLYKFTDIYTSDVDSMTKVKRRDVKQEARCGITTPPAVETAAAEEGETNTDGHSVGAGEGQDTESRAPSHEVPAEDRRESTSYVFRSGPTSFIELEEHEENGETVSPLPRVETALSVSDLCAPPLQPLTLQPKDKVNLGEMFKCLWSTLAKNDAEINPDQFDWFFYKDRAMGILEDLNGSTFCNGKILLGSYMKKPLWVDHNARTVFNLLSSSVSVTVDCIESCYSPGQAFVVHCGCAYSIKNVTAQPAVLYFTRMLAESSD